MAKLAQSYWILALVAVVTVAVGVHAVLNRHDPLNWVGVALWIILFITILRRRMRTPEPPSRKPPRRRK